MNKIPERIGPYRILDLLGKGGMGIVYRAEHTVSGAIAAVKTVRVGNPKQVASIRREIRALARISHPGVVRILEEGIADDLPWYAMSFLEGVTLRQLGTDFIWGDSDIPTFGTSGSAAEWQIPESPSTPSGWWTRIFGATVDSDVMNELRDTPAGSSDQSPVDRRVDRVPVAGGSLPMVLDLVYHLSEILAYLHGEGIVHGDLKPDNILIRSDGKPVIMDFGLVTRVWDTESRERLGSENLKGGTIVYVAPEQIKGGTVDARADLYSLGCILYELLTGRLPFHIQDPIQLIKAQIEQLPVPPSEYADGVPEILEQLITQLLEKRPGDRPGHADCICAVLSRLGAGHDESVTYPTPRSYLYRSRFTGRKDELARLSKLLDSLNTGQGGFIFIAGESGIGKTRLLMALSRQVRRRKFRVSLAECAREHLPGDKNRDVSAPLYAFRQPLQEIVDYCRENGPAETERIFGANGSILARYIPEIMNLEGQERYSDPPEISVNAAQLRLYNALLDVLDAYTETCPTMIIIDDLHCGDHLTLNFLEFSNRIGRLSQIPLILTCSYRKEELGPGLGRLLEVSKTNHIKLERFSGDDIASMIGDMLGISEPNAAFVDFLTKHSEGNPFFVAEYLRAAVSESILFRDRRGYWHISEDSDRQAEQTDFEKLSLPRSLRNLVERRLAPLSGRVMEVARSASVLGEEIPVILLWNMISSSDEVLDDIDMLIRRQILRETSPGYLRFVHDKIRTVIYEGLDIPQLERLHQDAASILELLHVEDFSEYHSQLALHWEKAGNSTKAQFYFLCCARQAVSQFAMKEAEEAYRSYLNLVISFTRKSLEIYLEFIKKVLLLQARHSDAKTELESALEISRNLGEPIFEAQSLLGLGRINRIVGNIDQALALTQKALAIYRQTRDAAGEAAALNRLGEIRFHQGNLEEAKTAYTRAADIYRELGDLHNIGIVLANTAPVFWMQGQYDRAAEMFEQALDMYRKSGNKLAEAIGMGNIANVQSFRGNYREAAVLYESALKIMREVGDRHNEGITTANLGNIYILLGEKEKARVHFEHALEIHREILDRRMEGVTLGNLALVHQDEGSPDLAREYFNRALKIQREISNAEHEVKVLMEMANLERLYYADYESAETRLLLVEKITRKIGDAHHLAMCQIHRGHLELARGRSGRDYLEKSRTIVDKYNLKTHAPFMQHFNHLERCVTLFESGTRLVRGESRESIPEGLRRSMMDSGEWPSG